MTTNERKKLSTDGTNDEERDKMGVGKGIMPIQISSKAGE